jgi:hypothetical protein
MTTFEIDEPCSKCGRSEPLADFEQRRLCYDCWHAARESTPPYHVVSKSNPSRYSHCAWRPSVYTLAEALERAAQMNADDQSGGFEPKLADSWAGERRAHPAYMQRRRAAILAEHPEYADTHLATKDET